MTIKQSRRHFLMSTAGLIHTVTIPGCVLTFPQATPIGSETTLYSSQYLSLNLAMQNWASVGGTLVIDQDQEVADNIYVVLRAGKKYHLTTEGRRLVSYTGSHFHWFIRILGQGSNPFSFDGDLTIDGQNNANLPFWLQFDSIGGVERRDCIFDGRFVCRNARMKTGNNTIDGKPNSSYDTACMKFSGGFETLRLRGLEAISATRESGTVVIGSKGSRGIVIVGFLGTDRSAKHIHVSDFLVDGVSGDDKPCSVIAPECDGLLIFKSAELEASEPIIERGRFRECLGRSIKLYSPAGGAIARDLLIERSGNLLNVIDINFQHGDGLIENVVIRYSEKAHGTKLMRLATTPISFATGYSRPKEFPFGKIIVRNIRIIDTTGVAKLQLVGLSYFKEDSSPREIWLEDIQDTGTSDVLFRPAALGRFQDVSLNITNVDVDLMVAACETDDPLHGMRVFATNFVNRSAVDRPVLTYLNGKQRTVSWGRWQSKGMLKGFHHISTYSMGERVLNNGFEIR